MELKDIVEMKTVFLSGVSFGQEQGNYDVANTMTIVLDGQTLTFVEDPDDGYRSYMKEIRVGGPGDCTNTFPPVECSVDWGKGESTYGESEIVALTVKATGKVVVEVGTDNTDDYYPWCVQRFDPTAMAKE